MREFGDVVLDERVHEERAEVELLERVHVDLVLYFHDLRLDLFGSWDDDFGGSEVFNVKLVPVLILLHFLVALRLTVRFSLFIGRISLSLHILSLFLLLCVFFGGSFLLIFLVIGEQVVVELPLSSSPPRILLPKLDTILQFPILRPVCLLVVAGVELGVGGPGDVEHHVIVIHCCRLVYYNN